MKSFRMSFGYPEDGLSIYCACVLEAETSWQAEQITLNTRIPEDTEPFYVYPSEITKSSTRPHVQQR